MFSYDEIIGEGITNRKTQGFDDITVIHWVDDGKPRFAYMIDTMRGLTDGKPGFMSNLNTRGKYLKEVIKERTTSVHKAYISNEDSISRLLSHRPDIDGFVAGITDVKANFVLDSISTDALLKMSQKGHGEALFKLQEFTIKNSDHYNAIRISKGWGEDSAAWLKFVREETEEEVLDYIRYLQRQELRQTGAATRIGDEIDGVYKIFDKEGNLIVEEFPKATDKIPTKFVKSDKTVIELDVNRDVLTPKLTDIGPGQRKLTWSSLPDEFEIHGLKEQIENIQKEVSDALGLNRYNFYLFETPLAEMEDLQRQAGELFERKLADAGLTQGPSSQVSAYGLSNNYHPDDFENWMNSQACFASSRPYDHVCFIEDGGGKGKTVILSSETRKDYTDYVRHKFGEGAKGFADDIDRRYMEILKENLGEIIIGEYIEMAYSSKYAKTIKQYIHELYECIWEYQRLGKTLDEFSDISDETAIEVLNELKQQQGDLLDVISMLTNELHLIDYTWEIIYEPDGFVRQVLGYLDSLFSEALEGTLQPSKLTNKMSPTQEEIEDLKIHNLITFTDEYGEPVIINGKKAALKFDWNEVFENANNPLQQYGSEQNAYLLLPIYQQEIINKNSYKNYNEFEDENILLIDDHKSWSLSNIHMKLHVFKQNSLVDGNKQKNAWIEYLKVKGYSQDVINWIARGNHEYDLINSKLNEPIAKLSISIMLHEQNRLLNEFKVWLINMLREHDSIFEAWSQGSELNDIWNNFTFKKNGKIKANHDGCELTYDGLKKKQPVYMKFIDYATYSYLNETEDWSYISTMWSIGGYDSGMEEYVNKITIQGLGWIYSPDASPRRISKLSNWLIHNAFSVVGII